MLTLDTLPMSRSPLIKIRVIPISKIVSRTIWIILEPGCVVDEVHLFNWANTRFKSRTHCGWLQSTCRTTHDWSLLLLELNSINYLSDYFNLGGQCCQCINFIYTNNPTWFIPLGTPLITIGYNFPNQNLCSIGSFAT